MMLNELLQKSAQLLKVLVEIAEQKERPENLDKITTLLDERGVIIEKIKQGGFRYDESNKMHTTLFELDKGIREKLDIIMQSIKDDIKDVQKSKKFERQYIDPYGDVRHLNARYYDGKK